MKNSVLNVKIFPGIFYFREIPDFYNAGHTRIPGYLTNKLSNMTTPDFSTAFSVDQRPEAVFNAINNVRGWWSENIEGGTDKLNDEFTYQYQDMHKCTMKITELIPGKKVVWQVLNNYFNFTKDKNEWKGDNIEFEISEKDNRTQVHFTHHGLVPAYECYDKCYAGWSKYINSSLQSLITTGKGQPNPKEDVTV